ncbi:hypothetical protein [Lacrimispora indolis]|uniref:hypothetical protein n=1 Tax=Lacrimispora indolis TaxID=69825 RepID=UPI0004624FD1|nr:hypothetical protein [[Clostridium] methoxybenzovorans]
MTFDDFISSFSTNSCVKGKTTGEAVFDLIMSDEIRIKMYDCLKAGITPLSACAEEIELLCSNDPNCDLDLSNNTVRQTIGRMIKVSVEPFGYTSVPKSKARIPKSINSNFFDISSKYVYVGNETQTVKKTIVDC